MSNVLYLKKMGCDFWKDENLKSDIGNYRVRTTGECIRAKNGRVYFLEFSLWRDRKKARYTHKITGKPLKSVQYDIINPEGVSIDTEFTDDRGYSWRDIKIENALNEKNYGYTKSDILTIVNEISIDHYNEIIFV